MGTFAVIVHRDRAAASALAESVARWLDDKGHVVRVPMTDAVTVPALAKWAGPDEAIAEGVDLAISVGGDGTMLRAVNLMCQASVPVLGVHVGHLGYLTEVEPGVWQEALERWLAGEHRVDLRMTLEVHVHHTDGDGGTEIVHTQRRTALNDAVLEKLEAGHTVQVGVAIGGKPFLTYAADGVIVATPTGSTAYNLSAGGPIVSPSVSALILTPVAPHLLFDRSLVLGPDETVRLEVLRGDAALAVDGQSLGRLTAGDFLDCRAGLRPARIVTFRDRDFRQILKTKFGLTGRAADL